MLEVQGRFEIWLRAEILPNPIHHGWMCSISWRWAVEVHQSTSMYNNFKWLMLLKTNHFRYRMWHEDSKATISVAPIHLRVLVSFPPNCSQPWCWKKQRDVTFSEETEFRQNVLVNQIPFSMHLQSPIVVVQPMELEPVHLHLRLLTRKTSLSSSRTKDYEAGRTASFANFWKLYQ